MKKLYTIPLLVSALTLVGCGNTETTTLESIKAQNPKVNYVLGDSFVAPKVVATYSDKTTKDVSSESSFSGYNLNSLGEQTVTVTYKDKFDQYKITVSENVIPNLVSITIGDEITEYVINQSFVKPVVTAHYDDESSKVVTNEATFSGYDLSKAGIYTVTVSYGGKSTSYSITVSENHSSDISLESFNQSCKNNILNNHNYKAQVSAKFSDTEEVVSSYSLYNLNDTALYDDEGGEDIFYGFVKQKNQGYVSFSMSQQGGGLLLGDFLSTNPNVGISELDPFCLESVMNASFTKSGRNEFTTTSYNSMAAIANLAFGEYAQYVSVPESIKATVIDMATYTFMISGEFTYRVDEIVNVFILVSNVGSVSNVSIENHVANPSYIYTAPTAWSDEDKALFDQYFGGFYPPFIAGASYSFNLSQVIATGMYVVLAEDYASGDLSTSYAKALTDLHFEKSESTEENKYVLVEEDEERMIKKTYSVSLLYASPSSDADIALYYPKGIFQVKYQYQESILGEVTSVKLLNEFLAKTKASKVIPSFPLDDDMKVTKFKDGTDGANKLSDVGDYWAFVAPSRTDYFRLYIPTYEEALTFITNYGKLLEAKGFVLSGEMGKFFFNSYVDDYGSIVQFGDIVNAGKSNYPGYFQIMLSISNATVDNYVDPEQPTLYNINVANVTGGKITIGTPESKLAKKGDTVVFSVTPDSGYKLDSVSVLGSNGSVISVVGPNVMTGAYSFEMPECDVMVGASFFKEGEELPVLVSLTVVSPKVDYEVGDTFVAPKVMGNYSDSTSKEVNASFSGYDMSKVGEQTVTVSYNNISTSYKISVKDKGGVDPSEFGGSYSLVVNKNTYTLTFNSDGKTGSYKRVQVNSSGDVLKEATIYFVFTKTGDKLSLTVDTSKNNSDYIDFVNGYCLFYSSHETNATGSVNSDGSIHMGLANRLTGEVTYYDFTK